MLEINYEKLLKNYNKDILIKTRAFNAGEEHLRFWVPSEDNIESVLNLIDSLKESKEFNYKIIFSKLVFNKENIDRLNLIFKDFSEYNCTEENSNYIYEFKIDKDKLNEFFSKKTKIISKKSKEKVKEKEVKSIPQIFSKDIIKDYYINEVQNFDFSKFKSFFEDDMNLNIKPGEPFKTFSSDLLNYKLILKVSPSNSFITDFSFKKNNSKNDFKWINNFFCIVKKLVENRPLREIKDHAAIYLIDMLRPKHIKSEGIIHPDNEGKIFYDLKLFFWSAYQSLVEDDKRFNRHYKKLSSSWKNLNEEKKIEVLNKELINFCNKNNFSENLKDLSVKRIEKDFKIVLNVSKEFLNKQKTKNYLLELEEILKKNVDFRLEIFIKMMLDVSKLRVGKSFKDFKV